jgi:cephalosporin hydroxylase
MQDDRAQFAEMQRLLAERLAADRDLIHRANALTIDLVPHKYTYLWSWLGVPIIQLPVDVMVLQEVIWETKPNVIVETGVARGGSLIFYASMLELLGEGEGDVVGVDIEIRSHNRESIEAHPLSKRITLIEGSSTDVATVDRLKALIEPDDRVMVILDSNHTHEHVLAELRAYAPLVGVGQFMVVADTGLGMPEAENLKLDDWSHERGPHSALRTFLDENDRFQPDPFFNAKLLISSSPGGFLRCLRDA